MPHILAQVTNTNATGQTGDAPLILGIHPQILFGILLLLGGAFGGFLGGIKTRKDNTVEMPFSWNPLKLGFIGDVLMGIGAAIIAIVFYNILPSAAPEPKAIVLRDLCAYLGFGVAAGFTGIKILEKASGDFLALENKFDRKMQIAELLSEARYLLATDKFDLAVERFKDVLKLEPNLLPAKYGYATARNFANPNDHKEPVAILTEVVTADPQFRNASYNRACIMALNKDEYRSDQIASDLREAFRLDSTTKKLAASDSDFDVIRNEKWFKDLFA
jgi:tetratricopeptide (TPR) repeat protein